MRKNILITFSFILVLLAMSFVAALELPTEPMLFYGDVENSEGIGIPNGYFIVAKIDGVISGECEVINGKYGMGDYSCVIVSHVFNKNVNFFIGDLNIGSHPFEEKAMIELDFVVDDLPGDFTPLSNGVCEPDKGECTYNLLDCDASLTNACASNGVCDTLIGETCEFTSSDCGVCPTESTGGSSGGGGGGGSSGGGGGSGSSSSSSTTSSPGTGTTATPTLTFEPEQFRNATNETEEQNPEDQVEEERTGFGAKITGAVTGFAKTSAGKVIGIIILILVVLVILFFIAKMKLQNSKDNNSKSLKKSAAKNKKAAVAAMKANGKSKKKTTKKKTTKKKTTSKKKVKKK